MLDTQEGRNSELSVVDALLQQDLRNNSAWNHRWFVMHSPLGPKGLLSDEVRVFFVKLQEMRELLSGGPANCGFWLADSKRVPEAKFPFLEGSVLEGFSRVFEMMPGEHDGDDARRGGRRRGCPAPPALVQCDILHTCIVHFFCWWQPLPARKRRIADSTLCVKHPCRSPWSSKPAPRLRF